MLPKSARKRQRDLSLVKAREKKRRRESGEGVSSVAEIDVRIERRGTDGEQDKPADLDRLLVMTEDAADTDDEAVDLDSSMKSDVDLMVEAFCDDWVSHLDRDDSFSLSFLVFSAHKAA